MNEKIQNLLVLVDDLKHTDVDAGAVFKDPTGESLLKNAYLFENKHERGRKRF
jgi:hypothetical protein